MTNKEFFTWIYNRLIQVHGENSNVDYMLTFKRKIDSLQDGQVAKIRAEIESQITLIDTWNSESVTAQAIKRKMEYLLRFIDSLPDEPKESHFLNAAKEIIEEQERSCQTCTNDKGGVTCVNGNMWEGEPVTEKVDLEKEVDAYIENERYFPDDERDIVMEIARKFYELGRKAKKEE